MTEKEPRDNEAKNRDASMIESGVWFMMIPKKQKYKGTRAILALSLVLSLMLTGCGEGLVESLTGEDTSSSSSSKKSSSSSSSTASTVTPTSSLSVESDIFTDRDITGSYDEITAEIVLSGSSATVDGSGASVSDSVVTITAEGTYHITGSLTDGQIVINADGCKVQLLLDGVTITSSDTACIEVQAAKKVFLTMAEDTTSTLTDGDTRESEESPDACVYSKAGLTLNGSGTLVVNGNYSEGIHSTDELVICTCTIDVTSVDTGIKGKDYVAVASGDITIESGGDGLKANNDEDETLGYVYIEDGTFSITSTDDAIQSATECMIIGGTFTIESGGGTENAETKSDSMMGGGGGFGGGGWGWGSSSSSSSDDESDSPRGIQSGTYLTITGGTFTMNTADDALHSNGTVLISGGNLSLAAGDKGIHADDTIEITDEAVVDITESYEGVEATVIRISGGVLSLVSSDDGFNASDGSSTGAAGSNVSSCLVDITGGYVYVNAAGDGIDSNGSMTMTGGTVLVDGPTDSSNGALDANGSINCTGGLLIAAGASGMAEYPEDAGTIVMTLSSSVTADTLITVLDSSGNEIVSYAPSKTFNSYVIYSEDFESGETYTFYGDGTTDSSALFYGLFETGGYNDDGTELGSVELSSSGVSTIGSSASGFSGGGMAGMGGGNMGGNIGGGGDMSMPDDVSIPDDISIPDDMEDFSIPDDMSMPDDIPTDGDMGGNMGGGDMGGYGGGDMDFQQSSNLDGDFGGGDMPDSKPDAMPDGGGLA